MAETHHRLPLKATTLNNYMRYTWEPNQNSINERLA